MEIVNNVAQRTFEAFVLVLLLGFSIGGFIAWIATKRPKYPIGKAVDVVIVLVSFFGVFQIVAELKKEVATNWMRPKPDATIYATVEPFSKPIDAQGDCRKYIRGEFSPPNFDEVAFQQDALCAWLKKFYAMNTLASSQWIDLKFPRLPQGLEPTAEGLRNAFPRLSTKEISSEIKFYEDDKKEYEKLLEISTGGDAEMRNIVGGLLISLAAGLALAKITWSRHLRYD